MENQFSEEEFVLPESEIDALKIEGSNLPPEKEKEIKEISQEVNQTIVKLYGKYMSPEAHERLKKVPNRILVLPEEQYRNFEIGWGGEDPSKKSPSPAYNTSRGDMIVVNEDVIKKLTEVLKPIGGTDTDSYTYVIAHETAHFIQNQELPRMLMEVCAYSCALEVCKKLKRRQIFFGSINTKRAKYYTDLLEKTGDTLHKVLFGKDKTDESKYFVLGTMKREELQKLFPSK
ncbi:MAG TPA: hypothetical protein PLI45_02415 [Candidatus Woesebacteria bacterium]|nr:hypothetical protein [Candidatus Woesebacteria bacterium]